MAAQEYNVIGASPPRSDGVSKVTGTAQFSADIQLPGLLYGKVLRSPHVHARIRRLDLSRAAALPGVLAVATAQDFPRLAGSEHELGETSINTRYLQDSLLARETVKWQGHPVAAVAAVNPHVADEALALIEVEYEPLPAVTDLLAAMEPDAPVIHPDLRTAISRKPSGTSPTNVALHMTRERGNVAEGFAAAAVTVEREYRTTMVHQGYLEPQSTTVQVTPDGKVTIWTATQGHFGTQATVAELLQIPPGQIRVVPMEVGGAFGGKHTPYLEPIAAILSRKSGRPVKMTLTRAEVLQGTGPTPGSIMRIKLGADREGHLTALSAWIAFEAGAYPGSAIGVALLVGFSQYRIPHLRMDGFDVVLNLPKVAAYRAPGATQAAFALESAMDDLAAKLRMDPIDLRLRNASREGDVRTDGVKFGRVGFVEVLEAAQRHPAWTDPLPGRPGVGRGVAAGYWLNVGNTSASRLTLNLDGSVNLMTGSVDLTGTRTTMAQIAAEVLGLDVSQVNSSVGDTESIARTDGTGGSRTTFATGIAVHKGALAMREELQKRAARLLESAPEDLAFTAGTFAVKSAPERSLTVAQLAAKQTQTGGPISVTGLSTGLAAAGAFALHIADVEVDPETGKVTILRYTAFQDVGKAIHPVLVEGQIQGAAVQGIGWALTEEYAWADGVMKNPTLLDYKMPVSLDVPDIGCVLIEVPAPEHPYGVRGVGEVPIIPPPAALAAAVHRATGVRFTQLPMSPERVWQGIRSK